jgi:hypothetical protein
LGRRRAKQPRKGGNEENEPARDRAAATSTGGIGHGASSVSVRTAAAPRRVPGHATAQRTLGQRKPSSPMFDQIKTLAGEWEGKTSDGTVVRTSYRVVSNGSAVMNVLNPANELEK